MRLNEIEDGEQIVTKDYLNAELVKLELRLFEKIVQSERATRTLIFGTYALIIAAVFVNHFWR